MGTIAQAEFAAVDVVVELAQQLLALVHCLVIVEATEQGQLAGYGVFAMEAGIVLIPDVLQAAAVEGQAEVVIDPVITTEVGHPRGIDNACIEGGEVSAHAAFLWLAHGVQSPALHLQAIDAGVLQGHAAEAFRQQAGIAVVHHRGAGKDIAGLQYRVEQPHLEGAAEFGVLVFRLALAVHRQQVDAAAGAVAAIAGVELEPEHGEGVQAHAHGARGEAGFEAADDAMGPHFAVAIAGRAGLAVAEVTVHIEVAVEDRQAAAFDETLGLAFSRSQCSTTGQCVEHGDGYPGLVQHWMLLSHGTCWFSCCR
ncbi:hypothetical protein D9M71_387960 [compost metagenome]